MDFELVKSSQNATYIEIPTASATVIEAGDMVTISSWLCVKADASSTALWWTPSGSADGDTVTTVLYDPDAIYKGTADANFAVANRWTEVDLVMSTADQLIDLWTSTTDVFKVWVTDDAGTVGSTADVYVKINKQLI